MSQPTPAAEAAARSLVREVQALASAVAGLAAEMAEYAEAVAADETLAARLGARYGTPGAVAQMLQEVEHRTRKPEMFPFRMALAEAVATAQREAGAEA